MVSIERTQRVARAARRRRTLRRMVSGVGIGLCAGATVGGVGALLDGWLNEARLGWWIPAGAALAGLVYGVGSAMLRRGDEIEAAAEVDERLGLRDRLSSTLALVRTRGDDPFVALAARDAERVAEGVKVREATPIRFGATWLAWPVLGALAVGSVVLAPALIPEEAARAQQMAVEQEQRREQAREALQDARRLAQDLPQADEADIDGAGEGDLDLLRQIDEALSEEQADPDEALSRTAEAFEQRAQELEQEAEQAERELEALQERFADLESQEEDQSASAALREALRRGDLNAAAEQVEALRERVSEMSPQERAAEAERLRQLAESIEQQPGAGEQDPISSLMDRGLDQQSAEELANETNEQQIQETLERQGVDPRTAREMGEQIAQENRRRQAERQAEREAQDVAESLERAADQIEQPPQGGEHQQQDQPPPGEMQQTPPREAPSGAPGASPEGQPDQQPEDQQANESGGSSGDATQQEGAPMQEQTGEGGAQRPQQQGGNRETSGEPQPGEGASPGEQPGQEGSSSRQPQEQQPGQQPGQGGEGGRSEPRGAQPGAGGRQPGQGEQGGAGQSEGPQGGQGGDSGQQQQGVGRKGEGGGGRGAGAGTSDGLESLGEKLRELERRGEAAGENRRASEQSREAARRLWERMSKEEQEQWRRWAEQQQRERGEQPRPPAGLPERETARLGGEETPVDARRRGGDERVTAEWFNPNRPDAAPRTGEIAPPDSALRDAAKATERAIEERTVPRRYHDDLRRYSSRFRERTDAPSESAPPAPPAEDAGEGDADPD